MKLNAFEITLVLSYILQCEELVSLLLNTVVLSVPLSKASERNFVDFSHGQYFYSLFSDTINQQLLKNLDVIVIQLMESSVSNPQMVLSFFFKRTNSYGNVRSKTSLLRLDVTECLQLHLGSVVLIGLFSGLFCVFCLLWFYFGLQPIGTGFMVLGNLTRVQSACLLPTLKSMNFRNFA